MSVIGIATDVAMLSDCGCKGRLSFTSGCVSFQWLCLVTGVTGNAVVCADVVWLH